MFADLKIGDFFDFNPIMESFKEGAKIDIDNGILRFSHPSYSEAIKYLLSKSASENARKILINVLNKLADNNKAAGGVSAVVAENFDKLPDNVKNELLMKLGSNDDVAMTLIEVVKSNFDNLTNKVRNLFSKRLQIFDFLAKIGMWGSLLYYRFEDVYVAPIEYEEITKT